MVLKKTVAKKDQVQDAESGRSIASTFGSHSMAIIISELINAHVEGDDEPEEGNSITLDSEKEAEEYASKSIKTNE